MPQLHRQTHTPPPSPAATRLATLRLRSRLAGDAFLAALDRYRALRTKAGYNDQQPRHPRGNPGGGRWSGGGDTGARPADPVVGSPAAAPPGAGHNQGPPLEEPPVLPQQPPADRGSRLEKAKEAAKWLALFGARRIPPVAAVMAAVEVADWLRTELPSIRSYRDLPKTIEELVDGAREARSGYHRHHIAEQAPAAADGFPRSMIDGPGNAVSVPIYKHREISGYYQRKDPNLGLLSPREFLRGKSWAERQQFGRDTLIKYKVLKP